jgi:hypothetical protein
VAHPSESVKRVFITENRVNGLSFPDCRESIIVFGLGYGLERLADIAWMRTVDVQYCGDIDTHGFGILNRLRAHLPHAHSFLMNPDTLHAHRNLWGQEPVDRRYTGDTLLLTQEERALFDDLRLNRLGERVRLEQERISYAWLGVLFANSTSPEMCQRLNTCSPVPAVRCRLVGRGSQWHFGQFRSLPAHPR